MIRPIEPIKVIEPARPIASININGNIFLTVAATLLLLGAFIFASYLMLKATEKILKINNKTITLVSTMGIGLILVLLFGTSIYAVKGMALCLILLYASLSDIRYHEVPDFIWVMITILALVNFNPKDFTSMILGVLMVFIPQVAVSIIRPDRAIGGADIKISTALAFLLGAEKGIFAIIIGLGIAIITMTILRYTKKIPKNVEFPLVPFLAIGGMVMYLL